MIAQLFDLLEVAHGARPRPDFALRLDASWREAATSLLPEGPCYVGIAPGAGGAHKRWPLERFVALALAQHEAGRVAVFLLGPDEAGWRAEIATHLPAARFPLQEAPTSSEAGPSPLLTIALGQRLAAAVANDSGTGHLIAASGCKMVSLFGPTRAAKFAPCASRLEIVEAARYGSSAMDSIPLPAVADALGRVLAAEKKT
jgi:ADP-heptose:LPS heptosyltransferase